MLPIVKHVILGVKKSAQCTAKHFRVGLAAFTGVWSKSYVMGLCGVWQVIAISQHLKSSDMYQ